MSCIRVLILAGKGESTRLMFNGIKDSFSVEKVIIEEPVPKKQLLTQRLKRFGLLKVIGQILFMAYNRILLKIKHFVYVILLELDMGNFYITN